jgi:hypothetical protein
VAIDLAALPTKERLIRLALRLSCLCVQSGLPEEEAVERTFELLSADDDPAEYPEQRLMVGQILDKMTDPEALAAARVQAVQGTGLRRLYAAYQANAGVLPWVDVERIASE